MWLCAVVTFLVVSIYSVSAHSFDVLITTVVYNTHYVCPCLTSTTSIPTSLTSRSRSWGEVTSSTTQTGPEESTTSDWHTAKTSATFSTTITTKSVVQGTTTCGTYTTITAGKEVSFWTGQCSTWEGASSTISLTTKSCPSESSLPTSSLATSLTTKSYTTKSPAGTSSTTTGASTTTSFATTGTSSTTTKTSTASISSPTPTSSTPSPSTSSTLGSTSASTSSPSFTSTSSRTTTSTASSIITSSTSTTASASTSLSTSSSSTISPSTSSTSRSTLSTWASSSSSSQTTTSSCPTPTDFYLSISDSSGQYTGQELGLSSFGSANPNALIDVDPTLFSLDSTGVVSAIDGPHPGYSAEQDKGEMPYGAIFFAADLTSDSSYRPLTCSIVQPKPTQCLYKLQCSSQGQSSFSYCSGDFEEYEGGTGLSLGSKSALGCTLVDVTVVSPPANP